MVWVSENAVDTNNYGMVNGVCYREIGTTPVVIVVWFIGFVFGNVTGDLRFNGIGISARQDR